MSAHLVSCVVPTYNSERHLRETLDSIVGQTYRPIELVVADDGSTDGTADVVAGYSGARFVAARQRGGPAATRNLGIDASRGELIAFLDADDLWAPEKLALQVARFKRDPGLDVCVSHIQRFADGGVFLGDPVPGFLTTAMLARRPAFDRVGGFDPGLWFSDSTDWFLRANEGGLQTCLLAEALTLHRVHRDSLSRSRGEDARGEFLRVIKAKLDRARRRS